MYEPIGNSHVAVPWGEIAGDPTPLACNNTLFRHMWG